MKVNESLPALQFFVEKMDKLNNHCCLSCLRENLDPLQMYMHLGDIKFVKLCLQCPLVDFTNALVDVIGRPDVGFNFDFKPFVFISLIIKTQCQYNNEHDDSSNTASDQEN